MPVCLVFAAELHRKFGISDERVKGATLQAACTWYCFERGTTRSIDWRKNQEIGFESRLRDCRFCASVGQSTGDATPIVSNADSL
jgi:hypothetical protein